MTLSPDLLDAVTAFCGRRSPGHPLLVASDFDGVLAPLVDDPAASRPTTAAAAALGALAAVPQATLRLALVSGRDLEALARLSSAPTGTVVVGSHGAERGEVLAEHGLERRPFALTDEQAATLASVQAGLADLVEDVDGAWVEDKPSAAVMHTRRVRADAAAALTAGAVALGGRLGAHTMQGKDVVEIAVTQTSKGHALAALRDETDAAAVLYLGDDVTDERAFEVLGPDDLTVKIGPGETAARFRVGTPEEAAEVLAAVARTVV